MFYLILAFCSSAAVSIVMRLSDGKVRSSIGMLSANYLACTLLAALDCGTLGLLPRHEALGATALMGVFNGLIYLSGFLMMRRNVVRNGVVLTATFMKLGLLVTLLISIVLFGEVPGLWQWVGFALAVGAIVLINYRPGQGSSGLKLGLLVLMVLGGLGDGMSKVFEEMGDSALAGQFLFYTFATSLILGMGWAAAKGQMPGKWEWIYGLSIGVPNYYSCKFLLWSLRTVPGVIAYPVYSVAGIMIVTLVGVLAFRERLAKHQWLAMAIIVVALVLLNL